MFHATCLRMIDRLTTDLHIAREQAEHWRAAFLRERDTNEKLVALALDMKREGFVVAPARGAALEAAATAPIPMAPTVPDAPQPMPEDLFTDELIAAILSKGAQLGEQDERSLWVWAEKELKRGANASELAALVSRGATVDDRDDPGEESGLDEGAEPIEVAA